MGRHTKEGLNFFPIDIEVFSDPKILMAKELIDPSGNNRYLRLLTPYIAIRLLKEIYKSGYLIEWNKDKCLTLANDINDGMTLSLLDKITICLIESGFFNVELYNKYKILTSRGIQKRWVYVTKKSNRKISEIDLKYRLYEISGKYPHQEIAYPHQEIAYPHQESANNGEESTQTIYSISKSKDNDSNKGDINTNNTESGFLGEDKRFLGEEIIKNGTESGFLGEEIIKNGTESGFLGEDKRFLGEEIIKNDEKELIDVNSNNILYSIERCRWNYFNNPQFSKSVEQAVRMLMLSPDPAECKVFLEKWSMAFNRMLINEGTFKKQISGKDGWVKYFPLWVNRTVASEPNPELLYSYNKEDLLKLIEFKKDKFSKDLIRECKKYNTSEHNKDILNEFHRIWSEADMATGKLKWEKEISWEMEPRFITHYEKKNKINKK